MSHAVSLLSLLAFVLPSVSPDEVRLRDGRVLIGSVQQHGVELVVTTRDGVVTVNETEVSGRRTDAQLRAELERLAAGDGGAFQRLELARLARGYGLGREMWAYADACLEQAAPGSAVERRLLELVREAAPELVPERLRQAAPEERARGLVRRVRPELSAARRAGLVALLAAEPGVDPTLRSLARREPLVSQRLAAIEALERRGGTANERFVQLRSVLDRDAELRGIVAERVRQGGDGAAAVRRLTAGLLSDAPGIRIRTATALAAIGHPAAVERLVRAGPLAGVPRAGDSFAKRAHMMQTTTRAFIRDFDVEIAQAAAVANPQIGNARTGVVLDVAVPAVITQRVQIERAYRQALVDLTGSDPGRDPVAWAGWLDRRPRG
ncbi:MAG: hypothetical protein AAF628_18155 [Planctomycetota bacterium]